MGQVAGKKVCIDPGHGGGDPGAVGPTGLKEKDVNLDVALRLKRLLEEFALEVRMTRTSDTNPSLDQRVATANSWPADVFVSVHHNANTDPSINGTETYYYKSIDRPLADEIHPELLRLLGRADRGIRQANYQVLRETTMPASLTEACYISNPEEEQLLRDPDFLEWEAKAIRNGILTYLYNQ